MFVYHLQYSPVASTVCLTCPHGLSCSTPDQDPIACSVSSVVSLHGVCMCVVCICTCMCIYIHVVFNCISL